MKFVLVHSPVLGPSAWEWVAEKLEGLGHEVVVPDLRSAAMTGDPLQFIDRVRRSVPVGWDDSTCVGHSGAGNLLPAIAASLEQRSTSLVFVDAGLPPCEGTCLMEHDFVRFLAGLAVEGLLPPWSSWWGHDVMADLVPDGEQRELVAAEMPRVPIAFFEKEIEVPRDWCSSPIGYLLLSTSYRDDAEKSRRRGWATLEHDGDHLDIVARPGDVARSIAELAEATA